MSKLEGLPIADLRFANERGSRRAPFSDRKSQIGNRQFAHYFVQRGWLHLILLTGVGIFIFPLVWMAATSMKTPPAITT